MEWIKCTHKTVLPVGEYMLRLSCNGFEMNKKFEVTENMVNREIPYHYCIAYIRIPDYNL